MTVMLTTTPAALPGVDLQHHMVAAQSKSTCDIRALLGLQLRGLAMPACSPKLGMLTVLLLVVTQCKKEIAGPLMH